MNVRSEIQQRIGAYLRGALSLSDLIFDVAAFDQEALDASRIGDSRAEQLLGTVDLLAAECTAGHRSEQSVRAELAALVAALPRDPVYVGTVGMSAAEITTGASGARSYFFSVNIPVARTPEVTVPATQGTARTLTAAGA